MDQNTLNIFLLIFLLIIVSCVIVVSYFFVRALKAIMQLAEELNQTAQSLREKVQIKAFAAIPSIILALISRFIRRR